MKTPRLKISRRRFLGGVFVAALGAAGYARFIEAERLQKSFATVPFFNGRKPPLKLLHLSDLHASPIVSLDYIQKAIIAGLEWKPDLICVTGDFITRTFEDPAAYTGILQQLSATAPTFASLGNHDGGKWAVNEGGYEGVEWISHVLQQ